MRFIRLQVFSPLINWSYYDMFNWIIWENQLPFVKQTFVNTSLFIFINDSPSSFQTCVKLKNRKSINESSMEQQPSQRKTIHIRFESSRFNSIPFDIYRCKSNFYFNFPMKISLNIWYLIGWWILFLAHAHSLFAKTAENLSKMETV